MNLEATLERLGGDRELLQSFIGFYDEDLPLILKTIERAVAAQDFESLQLAAHSLKGLAANFSADPCMALAGQLEVQAKAKDLTDIQVQLSKIHEELARLNAALQPHRRT